MLSRRTTEQDPDPAPLKIPNLFEFKLPYCAKSKQKPGAERSSALARYPALMGIALKT